MCAALCPPLPQVRGEQLGLVVQMLLWDLEAELEEQTGGGWWECLLLLNEQYSIIHLETS